ncbi:MAG: hypothetical protein GTO02_13650 [Candidatus Dadabacteria bacterium]|nr:hypothetical protein [Candidatus Dadabacteria bacterium]NIQ15392.1 hypothetical protein [Candidatus Dadabacteria bacterium]
MKNITHIHPGELPDFWNRSVIFFSNIESVVFGNIEELEKLESEVKGFEAFGGRLISVLNLIFNGRPNLLVLEKASDQSIFNYYKDTLKLSMPELLIIDHEIYHSINSDDKAINENKNVKKLREMLSSHPAKWVDGFITDNSLMNWAEKFNKTCINSSQACYDANNKMELHYYLLEKELPVIDTEVAASIEHIHYCLENLLENGYKKAVVKSQFGASGVGMITLDTDIRKVEIPDYMFYEGPCLVQGWLMKGEGDIKKIYSPSVQLFVDEKSVSLFDITEQILGEDSLHEGNIAIPPYLDKYEGLKEELLRQAEIVAKWVQSKNYRGPGSTDFIVAIKEDGFEVIVCEVNARFTGATYPSVLSRHFMPKGGWLLRNININEPLNGKELLNLIDEEGILFKPGESEGFLPVNFNLDDKGYVDRGQFLYLAENAKKCVAGMEKYCKHLPFEF